jgi:hypothetical protein
MATGLHRGQLDVLVGTCIAAAGFVGLGLTALLPEGQGAWIGRAIAGGVLMIGVVATILGATTWRRHRLASRGLQTCRSSRR